MQNEDYIMEYIQTRGLSDSTYQSVKKVLNHYSTYQQKTLHQLILEADTEEEQGIRWKRRTLKTRLTNYMNHLKTEMTSNSAKTYLKIVKSFYHHHEIEIHKLPKFNNRNAKVNRPLTYNDLPTKMEIRQAVELSNPLMRSLLLFLSSSGVSKVDALNLTIQDFINSTTDFHNADNVADVIMELQDQWQQVIPTFRNRRQKTNKYYVTFCSQEAVHEILNYLQIRLEHGNLQNNDRLFKISKHHYTRKFQELNTMLGCGKAGTYNKFRGHNLRKYHASNLVKAGMSREMVNVLQGKSNNAVDDVYFFEDENRLKDKYVECLPELVVMTDVVHITKSSREYQELLDNVNRLKSEVDELKKWWQY